MIEGARAIAQSDPFSAALFALTALVLAVFAAKVFIYAAERPDALLPLRIAVGGLALSSAVGLVYETIALATGSVPTISDLIDMAFNTHPVTWIVIFSGIMFLIGLGAVHFTRVLGPASGAVRWWVLVVGGVAYTVGGLIAGAVASRP